MGLWHRLFNRTPEPDAPKLARAPVPPARARARAAARARPMLRVLYERSPPGLVSSRGKVVMQPAWLGFTEPHPIETLAIVAALGSDGPRWFSGGP